MIRSLKFENFRCFSQLEIPALKRVNLFAGATNVGKTAILEGIYLMFTGADVVARLPSIFRSPVRGNSGAIDGNDYVTFWHSLFYERQLDLEPTIIASTNDDKLLKCKIWRGSGDMYFSHQETSTGVVQKPLDPLEAHVANQPRGASFVLKPKGDAQNILSNPIARELIVFSTHAEDPIRDAALFNELLQLEGGEERLLGLLKQIDTRLEKVRYLKAPGTDEALMYAYFGGKRAISVNQTGQGFSKLFSLFCRMLLSKGQLLLVDEIENGLYYESLPQIWRGIAALAESQDIQVFATTHSLECLLAAHEVFKERPAYDFALHRLQRVKGKLEVVTHDKGMLEVSLKTGLEVR